MVINQYQPFLKRCHLLARDALTLFLAQKLDPAKRGCSLAAATQSLTFASSTFSPRLRK
jgi:hypothetical protein